MLKINDEKNEEITSKNDCKSAILLLEIVDDMQEDMVFFGLYYEVSRLLNEK